jgi:hypothetical protein
MTPADRHQVFLGLVANIIAVGLVFVLAIAWKAAK